MLQKLRHIDYVCNVMAHAQKPDFVFLRYGRVHLNRWRRQFSRLLAGELYTSACRVCIARASLCSAVFWRLLVTHSILLFPLHFSSRASPCAITFQLDSTTSREYYRRFEDCQTSIADDDARDGLQPHMRTIPRSERSFILSHRRLAVRELADECPLSVGGCNTFLMEQWNVHCVAAKFVPSLLIDDQKGKRSASVKNCVIKQTKKKTS